MNRKYLVLSSLSLLLLPVVGAAAESASALPTAASSSDSADGDSAALPVGGLPVPLRPHDSWKAEGDQDNAYFGWSASTAGDVNGDGYADIIVGATTTARLARVVPSSTTVRPRAAP